MFQIKLIIKKDEKVELFMKKLFGFLQSVFYNKYKS